MPSSADLGPIRSYNRLLLLVAGLGGLLYGVDVGIIGGALPYLEATSRLNAGQLSIVVAAVLLGSVISTLFAGALADWIGRKPLMMLSGLLFVCKIEPRPAFHRGRRRAAWQRDLNPVRGCVGGLDRSQAADDAQRTAICLQHSHHRALARLWVAGAWPPVAGNERRLDRCRGSAVSGGVPVGDESRQRDGHLPMVIDSGYLSGGFGRNVLEFSRRRGGQAGRSCSALCL